MSDIHSGQADPSLQSLAESPALGQQPRKRRRRTIACTQCHTRKLRCDREYPICGRCQRGKAPTDCTYEDSFLWQQPNTVSSVSSTATARDQSPIRPLLDSTLAAQLECQQYRPSIAERSSQTERKDRFLETVLGAPKAAFNQDLLYTSSPRPSPGVAASASTVENDRSCGLLSSPSEQLDITPRVMLRAKGTKTRFNGSGIFASLMMQFHDMKWFAEEIRLSYPNLARFRPDLERVKKGLWKSKPLRDTIPVPDTRTLILWLPSRPVVDDLVGLYVTYIESTHRVLHVPSFLRDLNLFWEQRHQPDLVSPAFVAQLLLVLSCAWNLADHDALSLKNDLPLNCYAALEWIRYAERWLLSTDIKRPEIITLQLHTLLVMAHNCHGMNRSKSWLATGTLLKQAMLSGYHRDPSKYVKISMFNREMRRRIWATMVELDLQVALDRGMPPSVQASDYDTAAPLNINDIEIDERTTELPAGRPLGEITDSSFQTFMFKSLPLRLKACSLMHSPRISCRYDDILRMDWELNRHLSAIPMWPASEHTRVQHRVKLVKALLESAIGHSLLCIHTPFAVDAEKEPLFALSARSRLEVATMMLSTQQQLHKVSVQLSLSNMGDWTLHACCSILQLLHARDSIRGECVDSSWTGGINGSASSSTALSCTLPGFSESLLSLVEAVYVCLETRLSLLVKGAKEYFFMSALIALVKTKLSPARATAHKQEAVGRILSFAQTLLTKHSHCNHLGDLGLGNFAIQIPHFLPGTDSALSSISGFDISMVQPIAFSAAPSGEFDAFLDVFDLDDLGDAVLGD